MGAVCEFLFRSQLFSDLISFHFDRHLPLTDSGRFDVREDDRTPRALLSGAAPIGLRAQLLAAGLSEEAQQRLLRALASSNRRFHAQMRRAAFLATRAMQDDRDDASLSSDSDDSLGGIHDSAQMPQPAPGADGDSDDDSSDGDPHPTPETDSPELDEQSMLSDTASEHTDADSGSDMDASPPCTLRRSPRLLAGNLSYASEMPGD